MSCDWCARGADQAEFRADKRTRTGLARRCEDCRSGRPPVSLDYAYLIARALSDQDRRHLWELIRPVEADDRFARTVRDIEDQGGTDFRMVIA
ncbi:hypothetical protein JOF36_000764 [Pseudonocardia parietis]|uniref:Uncharacterized protein n=1 Tax=Pseudonocardia parietis TaxID=570936 RepID=A0ABS4VMB7_9PSEU|nr:hypothetical protein [Pseudonocardia parietis]